ncbi:hypothetical protein EVAR_66019_1 [Eumeta japonica]|uniref:Uncharacterized protein n=1 Tax=Eumeta variegata TaxID=151549 RepID=A0A4C1Z822_EUMVA|nr:hypothetical protein EVAR_66019_1 [Eumeta japonica]
MHRADKWDLDGEWSSLHWVHSSAIAGPAQRPPPEARWGLAKTRRSRALNRRAECYLVRRPPDALNAALRRFFLGFYFDGYTSSELGRFAPNSLERLRSVESERR